MKEAEKKALHECLLMEAERASKAFLVPLVVRLKAVGGDINVTRSNGTSALTSLICRGDLSAPAQEELVEYFLREGASANAKNTENGFSPLHEVAHYGRTHLVDVLMASGANSSIEANSGKTPVEYATSRGHNDTATRINTYPARATALAAARAAAVERASHPIELRRGVLDNIFQVSFPSGEGMAIGVAALALVAGLILMRRGEKIYDDKYMLAGEISVGVVMTGVIIYLTQELVKVKRVGAEMIVSARRRAGLLSDALTETVIRGANLVKALEGATKTTTQVIADLGAEAGAAVGETRKAIVRLKDEVSNSLVVLRGDASLVARAIQIGIDEGKFRPTANAKVDVGVDVKIDSIDAEFSGFKFSPSLSLW